MAKPTTSKKEQTRKHSRSNNTNDNLTSSSTGRRKNTSNKNNQNNNNVVSHQFYCSRLFSTSKTRGSRSKFPRFNKKSSSSSASSSFSSNFQNITPELFLAFIITAILVMFILFSEATAFPELRPVAPSDLNNHLDRFINFHQNANFT